MKYLLFILTASLCLAAPVLKVHGQQPQTPSAFDTIHLSPQNVLLLKDSILIPEKDTVVLIQKGLRYKIKPNPYMKSNAFYDSLYRKSKGHLVSREIYQLLITHQPEDKSIPQGILEKSDIPFDAYAGKTIGSISFVQVDLLEGSVDDTTKVAVSGVGKFFNRAHVKTRQWILKNYMLVKKGDKVNPGILSDNERVMRELPGISDARFVLVEDEVDEKTVNLIVITRDIFPIGITASASSFNNFSFGLWNYNTLGLNFDFGGSLLYDSDYKPSEGFEIKTGFRNLRGSFIGGELSYIRAFLTNSLRMQLSRKFLSPLTKYGGEIQLGWITDGYKLQGEDTLIQGVYNANFQDIWLGRSFLLGSQKSRQNIILSARYEREKFFQRPFVSADSNIDFQNSNIYLGKIAFSNLNYYKSTMIRAFEISEDIPYGVGAGITFGYMDSEYLGRAYFGASFSAAKYFQKLGYLSGNILAGGFYKDGSVSQGLFETGLFYYTPLTKINLYSMRNFIQLDYKQAITKDVEGNVNFGDKMSNLKQDNLNGNSTLVINYELVLFSPWYLYGFRFAPYLFADLGLISQSRNVFYKGSFYSAPGIGLRIGNESMAFKSAVIGIGFLPRRLTDQSPVFFELAIGLSELISLLEIQKPEILRRDVVFPY